MSFFVVQLTGKQTAADQKPLLFKYLLSSAVYNLIKSFKESGENPKVKSSMPHCIKTVMSLPESSRCHSELQVRSLSENEL